MNRRDFSLVPPRILATVPLALLFVASLFTLVLGPMMLGVFLFLLPAEIAMVVLAALGLVAGLFHPPLGNRLLDLSTAPMHWCLDGDGPDRLLAPMEWWMDHVVDPAFGWVWA